MFLLRNKKNYLEIFELSSIPPLIWSSAKVKIFFFFFFCNTEQNSSLNAHLFIHVCAHANFLTYQQYFS